MRENGYSAIEKTMIDNGEAERVIALREDFQRVMAKRYSDTIELLTGRSVVAFLNRAHLEPDLSMKIFIIDRPLDAADGLLEIDDDATAQPFARRVADADDAQVVRALDDLGVELGGAPDQDPVVGADALQQVVAAPVGAEVDVDLRRPCRCTRVVLATTAHPGGLDRRRLGDDAGEGGQ